MIEGQVNLFIRQRDDSHCRVSGSHLSLSLFLSHLPPSLPHISVGYCLVAVNGSPVTNKCLEDGRSALEVVNNPKNYPLSLKFARIRVSINERIMLLSMFHS